MKILIIEDEPELSNTIAESLAKEQYTIEQAYNYQDAMDKVWNYDYDCILLDIMLPGGSGLDVLQRLQKAAKSHNVIIISAKDSLDDKLNGLDLGADDYLTKPFHIAELNARIKAVLRRKQLGGKEIIQIGNTSLDIKERSVTVDDGLLVLNRKEFDILYYFMVNKNRLVTKTALAEHVWGDHIDQADSFDFVYYQIKNLRKKLQSTTAKIEIESIYGVGYKLIQP
ncbi:response regulator transcription factor [Reichenbachiella sp. MSK19-1]|uniref:response regulator transcription factor n=1 Tax=Reichenbachiella sp. MSK19-1 TaxID=1897631 RepID=UPI000E6B8825|nr:response regulator transcription factor [Reichenbachiella sp. MSK19-1]RJE74544.1 DNA-binding response regulator [Reichenbachiella sp. MSK19-1]